MFMNSVRSNNLSLKYQRSTTLGCKDIGIRKFDCMEKLNSFDQRNNKMVIYKPGAFLIHTILNCNLFRRCFSFFFKNTLKNI